jgi:anti-sigma factor RsiW
MDLDSLTPAERREALQAYLDGELSADDARRVASWLAVRPEARVGVEALRRLNDLLGAYEDEPVPEGFAERVMAAVGAGRGVVPTSTIPGTIPSHAGRLLHLPRWVAAAAAAVLVVALGLGVFLATRPTPSVVPAQESALVLESVPPDLLEHADVLLSLSDSEFDAVLAIDPADVAEGSSGG